MIGGAQGERGDFGEKIQVCRKTSEASMLSVGVLRRNDRTRGWGVLSLKGASFGILAGVGWNSMSPSIISACASMDPVVMPVKS